MSCYWAAKGHSRAEAVSPCDLPHFALLDCESSMPSLSHSLSWSRQGFTRLSHITSQKTPHQSQQKKRQHKPHQKILRAFCAFVSFWHLWLSLFLVNLEDFFLYMYIIFISTFTDKKYYWVYKKNSKQFYYKEMLRSTCTNQMPMSTVLETIKTLGRETVFIFRNFRDTSALFRFELRSWPSVKVKYSPGLQGLTSWLQVQCEGDTIWNAICNKYNFHNMQNFWVKLFLSFLNVGQGLILSV